MPFTVSQVTHLFIYLFIHALKSFTLKVIIYSFIWLRLLQFIIQVCIQFKFMLHFHFCFYFSKPACFGRHGAVTFFVLKMWSSSALF